jgi:transcriptional regulator with XRE-family HTH domain
MKIGEKIKSILTEKGWSQAKLAEEMGVSNQVVFNYLKRDNFTMDTLMKISKALNVPLYLFFDKKDLFGELDNPNLTFLTKEQIDSLWEVMMMSLEIMSYAQKKKHEEISTIAIMQYLKFASIFKIEINEVCPDEKQKYSHYYEIEKKVKGDIEKALFMTNKVKSNFSK